MSSSQINQPSTSSTINNQQSSSQQEQSTLSLSQCSPALSTFSYKFPSNGTEMQLLRQGLANGKELIKIVEIENCLNSLETSKLISNSPFRTALELLPNFVILKLKINENLDEDHAEKPKIHEFKIRRNILVSYESFKNESEKIIYWKLGKEENYLKFNFMKEFSAEFTNFVRDFLIENVNMILDFSHFNGLELSLKLVNLFDPNNNNLLMKAVESEQSPLLLDELLNLPFNIDQQSSDGKTAADIALEKKNFEILLQLLKNNSRIPKQYFCDELDEDEASKNIEKLMKINSAMHTAIRMNNLNKMCELIKRKPNLGYNFYNLQNESAAKAALNKERPSAYKILLENNCSIGLHENIESITMKMKEFISVVHDDASKSLQEKHLMILCANSQICHDDRLNHYRFKYIKDTFNSLNEISHVKPILQIVSKRENFKIHFDFNRSSIEFMNPSGGDQFTRGLYEYDNSERNNLYIAANELLNNSDKFAAFGTMAHELCHFAMKLTFCNDAKPYAIGDKVNEQKFKDIVGKYEENSVHILECNRKIENCENLISFFENLNLNSSGELDDFKREYIIKIKAHKNCIRDKNKIIEEYNAQIKKIERNNLKQIEQNEEILKTLERRLRKFEAAVINQNKQLEQCIEIYNFNKNDTCKFIKEMKEIQKNPECEQIVSLVYTYDKELWPAELIVRIPHMSAYYKNNPQRLDELKLIFPELFDYYDQEVMPKLSETLLVLEKLFNNSNEIKYDDLTESYKAKIHHSDVQFQGHKIKFKDIIDDKNSGIFRHLKAKEIREILIEGKSLTIGSAQEMDTGFYIERYFVKFNQFIPLQLNINHYDSDDELTNYDDDDSEDELTNDKYYSKKRINFHEIAFFSKMILLSAEPGAGKTTTFKHITVKLKEKFPSNWISYIDLKQHLRIYEKFEKNFNENQVSEILKEILAIPDEFESKIFKKIFNSGKVVLLFDGVDEISPNHNEFFIKFIESIRNSTQNKQWIATRPQHTELLEKKFNKKAYNFAPYNDRGNLQFIKNTIQINQKITDDEARKIAEFILKKIYENMNLSSFENRISSLLMLKMITELYLDDNTIIESLNMYSLYEKMVEKNKRKLYEKGEIVNSDRDNDKSTLTIWQVHQIYALKLIFENNLDEINELLLLKRWKTEKSNWTPEKISRYGFLYVDDWNTENEFSDFVHRTFAEFFVAQYFINEICELKEDVLKSKLRMSFVKNSKVLFIFIKSYLKNRPEIKDKVYKYIITSDEMQNEVTKLLNECDDDHFYHYFHNVQLLDDRFLKDYRLKSNNKTIFQYLFENMEIDQQCELIKFFKILYGNDWIKYTGYYIKKNFSIVDENFLTTIRGFFDNEEKYFELLYLLENATIPSNLMKIIVNYLKLFYRKKKWSIFNRRPTKKLVESVLIPTKKR